MQNKLLKVALIGKTNAGKSTLINSFIGEKVSIINKKINTTQELILGIQTINNTQIIFYDTPGINFLKSKNVSQKKFKVYLWEAIDTVDLLLYLVDVIKYNFDTISKDIKKISEVKKPIILVFNKIDLIKTKNILPLIKELKKIGLINDFFIISAKFNKGIKVLSDYLVSKTYNHKWIFKEQEITNKDEIYISNECTRNALLEYLHQEIPYNLEIKNILFRYLKNNDLKIKQSIQLNNHRYKPIILGRKGESIKRIRERSQKDIQNIFGCNIHLYLKVEIKNGK